MKTVMIKSSIEAPIVGLGTWQMQGREVTNAVKMALSLGYRLIDTALVYGNERAIGEALRDTNIPREELFITTKLPNSTDDAELSLRGQLDDLGLDYVDLLLIHWPPNDSAGEELWRQLIELHDMELARTIGVSNYSIEQVKKLQKDSGITPAVNQVEWSPFNFDMRMLEFCQHQNIVLESYSPLTQRRKFDDERIKKVAERYQKSPAQVMIRWCIERGVMTIPKASSEEHLKENLDVFDFSLDAEAMKLLDSCHENFSVLA